MSKYFALLTRLGADRLANAAALGTKIEITQMAVGDGGGTLPTPDTNQTALVGEKRRAAINVLSVDPKNTNQIIAEQVIPEHEGGWWIREIGLFDKDGVLMAVANCAETYKPQLQEGSGRTQTIRMVLIVSHTNAVTLKIDPSVVLATREYADSAITQAIREHEQSRRHPDATLTEKGFVALSNAVDSNSETQSATPKAVRAAYDFANMANNNANSRLEKARNGADILNKSAFIANLGLSRTVTQAASAIPSEAVTLPDGANITTYFPGKPSGFYKSGSGIAGSPDINSWNDYIWINHGAHTYGQLISLLTDSRIAVRTLHDGRWGEWHIASSQAELAKKFDKTGGVIQGAADVKGHLSSSAGVVKANTGGIQVEIKTADRITEITSTYGGGEWFTHHLPRSSGTFAHTSDIDHAVAQTHKDIRALQGKTQDASTAQRGLVQLSDSRTSLSSSMAATSLTVSQNYADMKGLFGNISPTGKELGVTYQSKQGFAVFVHVDGISSTGSNFLSAVVNGVNFRGSMCAPLANQRISISFMIPAGATYSVWQHSGVITDLVWVETDKR